MNYWGKRTFHNNVSSYILQYRLYIQETQRGERGGFAAGRQLLGQSGRAEVSRLRPHLALQYYPCQILTLQGWFMSPVSYTLYIYTDGIFPFLDGGVISTPVPFSEPPSSSTSFSLPLRYFNGNLSKFTSWQPASIWHLPVCVSLIVCRITQGCPYNRWLEVISVEYYSYIRQTGTYFNREVSITFN